MKKLILLFFVLVLKFAPSKAQWVTIPDANFVTWLNINYPSCMNGNQMNTTCSAIVNTTNIDVSNNYISDLTGVEYFANLAFLTCSNNQLTSLPALPNTLMQLQCNNNQITSLPNLPNSLTELYCSSNQLTSLPPLPGLTYLSCGFNQLTSLPNLPFTLQGLYFSANQITSLQNLPSDLQVLDVSDNQLDSIPALPSSLIALYCSFMQLTSLPNLPNSLIILDCSNNLLISLPTLPSSLQDLICKNNLLTSIPTLPNSLQNLNCSANQLTNLPSLPNSLLNLICAHNQLTSISVLPNNLYELRCNNNLLISLPNLPGSLFELICDSNQLISLPAVPNWMLFFDIQNNNISCINNLPQTNINCICADISNNPLTCVPNQTHYSLGLPLCTENDPINNPNNCVGVNITGNVFTDINSNCVYNTTDWNAENIPVKLYDTQNNLKQISYTINGVYSFAALQSDTFNVKVNNIVLPIDMACSQANNQTVHLDSTNQTISNINFPVLCDSAFDLVVHSVTSQGWIFPGQVHTLNTNLANDVNWYNLNCDSLNYSGTVTINVSGPVTYIAPGYGAIIPMVSGNTFNYTIANFNNIIPASFGLQLMTDTTAQANDQICVHVEISPNPIDADTTNNVYDFCYNVVNSYDPNMKEVYPVNVLPGYDDWFTYTIHFQNTGNAPAFNIRLRDTLDTQLDLNTFEVLGYSHPANVTVSGNILTVRFNNIILPDSTSDYEGSMGYFQYRLRPLPNLPNGSQISNTAFIYFDFNAPIITNTTENNFDITVSTTNLKSNPESFEIYPNPSTGIFTFKDTKAIQRVEVYNVIGQEIAVFVGDNTNKVSKQINLSNFSKGIYFAKINGSVVLKLVKE